MSYRARPEDYRLLGIPPQAGAGELDRAYQRAKALYAEGSLATYSMMDQGARAAMRDRIEEAFLRVGRTISEREQASFAPGEASPSPGSAEAEESRQPSPPPGSPSGATPGEEAASAPPEGSPPAVLDWTRPPGPQLKRIREDKGITLAQIAATTRIRSFYFTSIENGILADLPAPVYLRGFLLDYARRIGLPEPEGIAARYLEWAASRGWGRE